MVECGKCGKDFGSEEALAMHMQAKHPENAKTPLLSGKARKRIMLWSIVIVALAAVIGLPAYFYGTAKTLPPTSIEGHIEDNPPSHVLKEPMMLQIQKHMLEHADGSGPPGAIINYNCADFVCEKGLIGKLEAFAEKYPENVYVAPFPRMDAKIALTRHGRIEILEDYNEQKIDAFIRLG